MENQRLLLWVALGFVFFLLYQAWVRDHPPAPAAAGGGEVEQPGTGAGPLPAPPQAEPGSGPEVPQAESAEVQEALAGAPLIRVTTDVMEVEIDLSGGDLSQAWLTEYPVRKDQEDVKITLLDRNPRLLYQLRSVVYSDGVTPSESDFSTGFVSAQERYKLGAGADELIVPLRAELEPGLWVEKTYRFRRGSYAVEVDYRVNNNTGEPWRGGQYLQLRQRVREQERSMFDVESYSFFGPVFYDGDSYEKLEGDDLADEGLQQQVTAGWVAAIQHHFLSAIVPPAEQTFHYDGRVASGNNQLTAIGPVEEVGAGETGEFSHTLFVGPKLQEQLNEVGGGLHLTVDYGVLGIISRPLFWLLEKIESVLGNWGWSIIVVTLLIKLIFYKLSETSGRSMAKMRKLQPRIKHLQERYKDDRQALSQAMMDLYKREKINPAAGCLPILVQMPFFLAFYWVLLESVEMRQAPFMLWISDLSSKDPYFVLPLLMGAAMFGQQKLNPPPPDPVQAKVFMFLPIMFTGFFAFFPSGLVLYWFTNTLLSIAQQWRINKVVAATS